MKTIKIAKNYIKSRWRRWISNPFSSRASCTQMCRGVWVSAQFPAETRGKLTWKLGTSSRGRQTPLKSSAMSLLFCLACCRGPFQGDVVMLRSHCVWGTLFVGQNAPVWGSSDSRSGRAVCFKRVEVKELCPKGAEGEEAVKIERLIQEAAPKRLLPKLKQLCGRKKWLGLPVILAANSTSNLCTPEKLFP